MRSIGKALLLLAAALVLLVFIGTPLLSPLLVPPIVNAKLQPLGLTLGANTRIQIKPLQLALTIDSLTLEHKHTRIVSLGELRTSLSWPALLRQQISVNELYLNGVKADINWQHGHFTLGDWAYQAAPTTRPAASTPAPLNIRIARLSLLNSHVSANLHGQKQQLAIDDLSVNDLQLQGETLQGELTLKAQLNSAPIALQLPFSGNTSTGLNADAQLRIDQFALTALAPFLPAPLTQLEGLLHLDVNAALGYSTASNTLSIHSDSAAVNLTKLAIATPDANYETAAVELDVTKLNMTWASNKPLQASLDFSITNSDSAVHLGDTMATKWQQLQLLNATVQHHGDTTLHIDRMALHAYETQLYLPTSQYAASYSTAGSIDLNQLHVRPHAISAVSLHLRDSLSDVLLQPLKLTAPPDTTTSTPTTTEPTAEAAPITPAGSANQTPTFQLGTVTLDNSATVTIRDERLDTPFKHSIQLDKLRLSNVGSAASSEPSSLHALGKDGEYGSFAVAATLPSRQQLDTFTAALTLNTVALGNFAPYLKQAMGLHIKTGLLSSQLNLQAVQSALEGQLKLNIKQLKLSSQPKAAEDTLRLGSALSLNQALNTLADDEGSVKITIPISGQLNDPSFSFMDVISQVLKKAAYAKAKDYLITAFVPYANAVKITEIAGSYLLKMRFEPLYFTLPHTGFSPSQQAQITAIAALLRDNKIHSITACPKLPAQAETDSDSATAVAKALRTVLIEDHQIEPARVIPCSLALDNSGSAKARLEFSSN